MLVGDSVASVWASTCAHRLLDIDRCFFKMFSNTLHIVAVASARLLPNYGEPTRLRAGLWMESCSRRSTP